MPDLAELQREFAAMLLSDDAASMATLIADNGVAAAARLRIHRNTMITALEAALAISFPVVKALVGDEFFAQAARDFTLTAPPQAPLLSLYGGALPEFLASYEPASGLPYLPDVARLEWAVDQAACGPEFDAAEPALSVQLQSTLLEIAPSLVLLDMDHPAEAIWRAVRAMDDDALARIDPAPVAGTIAVWRSGDGAAVSSIAAPAAAFLRKAIAGASLETALEAAASIEIDPTDAITRDIFQASFARLTVLTP
jgi:hypothetical protein